MTSSSSFRLSRRALIASAVLPVLGAAAQQTTPAPPLPMRKLTLGPAKKALKPEAPDSDILAANGVWPGETIRVKRGEAFDLAIENKLAEATALHLHGYRGANSAEGIPGLGATPIAPGETRTVRVTTPDAGTYLYLPSLAGQTASQTERGLAGFFVVEESNPPAVDRDMTLALDDIRLDDKGVAAVDFNGRLDSARAGRLGNQLMINGKPGAETIRIQPNGRIRLRLANIANARIMPMKFENLKATVVALDGQACDPFDPLKRTVILVPGSRFDVMIDAHPEAGKDGRILIAIGAGIPILQVISDGSALPSRPPVERLAMNDLPSEIRLAGAVRSELVITGGLERAADPRQPPPSAEELARKFPDTSRIWQLNNGNASGFSGKPLFSVKRGATVVLALMNRTDWAQVITVHGHVFRLLHPLDDGWEPYFLDTLHLPEKATSRIAFDAVNPGKWAIRSTIPEHYDAGLFTWFEVTG